MSISSLNTKFSNKNNFELSKIEKCNIDSGIHIYFNFIKQWKTYKLDECHIRTLLLKVSTITHEEEYYIIDLIKHQILDQQLVIKELKINNHAENELVTELKLKTILRPEEYYYRNIKQKITSNPSKNCYFALFNK